MLWFFLLLRCNESNSNKSDSSVCRLDRDDFGCFENRQWKERGKQREDLAFPVGNAREFPVRMWILFSFLLFQLSSNGIKTNTTEKEKKKLSQISYAAALASDCSQRCHVFDARLRAASHDWRTADK